MVENYQSCYLATLAPGLWIKRNLGGLEIHTISEQLAAHNRSAECLLTAAKDVLKSMEAVGITERFEETIARFSTVFGCAAPERVERNNTAPERVSVSAIDAATRRIIEELTTVDQEVYSLAGRTF